MSLNLDGLRQLNQRLSRPMAPIGDETLAAVGRVAAEANAFFSARKVPVRVTVHSGPSGATLKLTATRKLTKSFSGRTPEEVVRDVLARRMPNVNAAINVDVARSLQR